MKQLLFALMVAMLFSCTKKERQITDKQDYEVYLNATEVATTSKYFELWNSKIQEDSIQLTSFGIVAGEYQRYFQNTGDIAYLKKAEQALEKAVHIAAIGKATYLRALARNYIAQHRFKEALERSQKATVVGSGVQQNNALLFDVHMELGTYNEAKNYLDSLENTSNFDYLIRAAKWNDHLGDLDSAIHFMKVAKLIAESGNRQVLKLWTYTNLADFYGHAGDIEASYEYYLKALRLDPQNAYAKKGIAWIVFSHERNPEEAMRILTSIATYYKAPDYELLKAEIANYMNKEQKEQTYLDAYYSMVQNKAYGAMYNITNVHLYLNKLQQYSLAVATARQEVANRPTPESYSLLAYSLFKKGEVEEATRITKNYVDGQSFEPQVLLQSAEIYKGIGDLEQLNALKSELRGALYELGPSFDNNIL